LSDERGSGDPRVMTSVEHVPELADLGERLARQLGRAARRSRCRTSEVLARALSAAPF
jgi:hypothetical protein